MKYLFLLLFVILFAGTTLSAQTAKSLNKQGIELAKKGELKQAMDYFNQAITIDGEFADAYANRGYGHFLQEKLEAAASDLSRAVELDPTNCVAYFHRAMVREDRGNLYGAIDDYDQTLECNPSQPAAHANRGLIRAFKLGVSSRQGAVHDFNKAIELYRQYDNTEGVERMQRARADVCKMEKDRGYTLKGCH